MKQLKDNGIKELIRLVKNELKNKANINHNHDNAYSKLNHTHSNYSLTTHNHDSVYSKLNHIHSYAASSHNHDDRYLSVNINNHNIKSVLFKFFYSVDEFYDDYLMYNIEFRNFNYEIIKTINTNFINYPSNTNVTHPVKPILTKTNGINLESTVTFNTEFAFINIDICREGNLYDYHTQLIHTNHSIINIHVKFLNEYKTSIEVIYDVNDYIEHFNGNY